MQTAYNKSITNKPIEPQLKAVARPIIRKRSLSKPSHTHNRWNNASRIIKSQNRPITWVRRWRRSPISSHNRIEVAIWHEKWLFKSLIIFVVSVNHEAVAKLIHLTLAVVLPVAQLSAQRRRPQLWMGAPMAALHPLQGPLTRIKISNHQALASVVGAIKSVRPQRPKQETKGPRSTSSQPRL